MVDKARAQWKGSQVKVRESQFHGNSHRRRDHVRVEDSQEVDATCWFKAHSGSVIEDSSTDLSSTINSTRKLGHCWEIAESFSFSQGAFSLQR